MMDYAKALVFNDGTRVVWRRDDTRRVTEWLNANGTVQKTVPYTAEENAAADDRVLRTNADALQAKALAALDANATYLALASPTAAQTTAQVKALTKQVDALIRLATQAVSSTDGS